MSVARLGSFAIQFLDSLVEIVPDGNHLWVERAMSAPQALVLLAKLQDRKLEQLQILQHLLGELLALDPGQRGPRVECGHGHGAEFVGYRPKGLDTVLGPVTLRRAWYHCTACGHGLAPRDAELGISGGSLSPGLRAMVARVGSSEPFAQGRRDLAELAGIELTAKRVERGADVDSEVDSVMSRVVTLRK